MVKKKCIKANNWVFRPDSKPQNLLFTQSPHKRNLRPLKLNFVILIPKVNSNLLAINVKEELQGIHIIYTVAL